MFIHMDLLHRNYEAAISQSVGGSPVSNHIRLLQLSLATFIHPVKGGNVLALLRLAVLYKNGARSTSV